MKNTTNTIDTGPLVEDVQALLAATAHIAEDKVVAARDRLAASLESGRTMLDEVQDRAIAGAKVTDEMIREHPYHAMGVALGIGAVVGAILARRL